MTRNPKQAPAPGEPNVLATAARGALAFSAVVDKYLALLGWSEKQLAAFADVAPSQFVRWRSGDRGVTRTDINRIAVALARAFGTAGKEASAGRRRRAYLAPTPAAEFRPSVETLDTLQDELCRAAGFTFRIGHPGDRIWARLDAEADPSKRTLRIGYPEAPPLAYGNHQGISLQLARDVCTLLRVEPHFSKFEWSELPRQLESGGIDMVAPVYFRLPSREALLRFSRSVGLRFRICAFLNAKAAFLKSARHDLDPAWADKIDFWFAQGGEGSQAMASIFAPAFFRQPDLLPSPEAALRHAAQSSQGKRAAFVTVAAMAAHLLSEVEAKTGVELRQYDLTNTPATVPVAFATLHSEPSLTHAIDTAIELLVSTGYPKMLIDRDPQARDLMNHKPPAILLEPIPARQDYQLNQQGKS